MTRFERIAAFNSRSQSDSMTVEYKGDGKTGCTACPYCDQDIDQYESVAKHIRHGNCEEVGW